MLRRKLENLERSGGGGAEEAWFVRRRLIGVYNANALPLLRGSGFVEVFHLLQAALELSLYASEGGCLCVAERGMGAPPARGTRLSALTLNNLGVYHRRRGQGGLHSSACIERRRSRAMTRLSPHKSTWRSFVLSSACCVRRWLM